MTQTLIALAIAFILAFYFLLTWLWEKLKLAFTSSSELNKRIGNLELALQQEKEASAREKKEKEDALDKFRKLQHNKISGDVKLGQKLEQLLPFLDSFPYPDDEIRGLFNPIDLIVFRDDEVVFVEIKSGVAQLSDKQRKIRDNIKAGRVRFEVHRIDEKGIRVKK